MPNTRNGLTFNTWRKKVDHWIAEHSGCGFGMDDFRDWTWWDCWDSETAPEDAAKEFLEEILDEMGFSDLITWDRVG